MDTIRLSDFSATDDRGLFASAVEYLKDHPDTTLFVEPRVYNITTEKALEAQKCVMEGIFGDNPQEVMFSPDYNYDIGIDFNGLSGCKISAEGAVLLINGFMEPVCIRNCNNIEVSGFTILHKRKPYSKGIVKEVTPTDDGIYKSLIEFDSDCPVFEKTPFSLRVLFYDEETEEPLNTDFSHVEFIDSHHIYSFDRSPSPIKEGFLYYSCHTYHSRPAVMIENAKDVTVYDVTVHNNCGMGFLGHRSENVTLEECRVTPVDGDHMSTNTDASHFTSMKGELNLLNCIFEYQGDDFSNIHGYFQKVIEKEDELSYIVTDRTPTGIHAQVIDYPDVGDKMELCDLTTLDVKDVYTVVACEPLYMGKWQTKVTLDRPLPDDFQKYDLMNVTRLPKVTVSGCASLDHYARSLVIKSRDVLVENCYFRGVRETAITIYAEPYWGEGASPANVTVRGCRFEGCGWARGPASAVLASVPVHKNAANAVKNVTVEENYVSSDSCPHAFRFVNVDGLCVRNNITKVMEESTVITNCTNVTTD